MSKYATYMAVTCPHKWVDDFMHSCDMFDTGQHLASIETITLSYEDEVKGFNLERAQKGAKVLLSAYEKLQDEITEWPKPILFAVYLVSITDWDTTKKNSKFKAVLNKKYKLRTLSDGKKYFMLCDYLKSIWVPYETDEHMFITSIW